MPKAVRMLLLIGLGVVLVGGLLWVTFRTEPVLVDLEEAVIAPMQVTIDVDGKTRIRDIYEISAPITGLAQRSPVEVGDQVMAGETVVAVVEPIEPSLLDARSRLQADAAIREAEARLLVAQTELASAEEHRRRAQSQFDRTETLVSRGVVSTTQLEDATEQLAIANAAQAAAIAGISMAQSSLERAQAELIEPGDEQSQDGACCVPLMAPANGRVLAINQISARPVVAGARLVTIGDPTELEIVADILSVDAVRLEVGALAFVDRWGGSDALEARLVRIEPAARTEVSALGIEEQRVDTVFEITSPLEAREGLGDGFSVHLRIVEWQSDQALQVPLSATFRVGEAWGLFAVEDGVAHERLVELGRRNARTVEVLGGLEAGTMVVTHPSDDLSDGSPVRQRTIDMR
ncbi:MAG: RND transporter [Rhizobiales bacterium]|nr:RND transporter [Hyphomicrobiales bacterium]MBO6697505.1 RND transporter [Hyphomicrobiales bacterium]MBO6736240.1 RND transporter [Hyphomicrobiales bacterium]MBO6912710.1 RND transporter [Hyphomicrobiales bacterium]MBO6953879.1 RND transporter [Hyphomicrobiales bacterium]